ncbi:hypothetical protein Ancab_012992 [Ancistrocladus abbreviatus]
MVDVDDDFGELYADIEVRGTSAINGFQYFPHLCSIQQEGLNGRASDAPVLEEGCSNGDGEEREKLGEVRNSEAVEGGEKNLEVRNGEEEAGEGVENGSDSEDDFDIVVNDDDCPGFGNSYVGEKGRPSGRGFCGEGDEEEEEEEVFGGDNEGNGSRRNRMRVDGCGGEQSGDGWGGERGIGGKGDYNLQYKHVRHCGAAFPSYLRVNGNTRRADWDDAWGLHKGSSLGLVAQSHGASFPTVAENGYGFSLPWYRTILDVNIDTFEQKPWRHPGSDITEFFNFGFNEESWKCYCFSVDQLRWKNSRFSNTSEVVAGRESRTRVSLSLEIKPEGQRITASQLSEAIGGQLQLPNGRAIQVEDSNSERQPSMDVRRRRNRDSDVVIEILVQDSKEDSSDPGKVEQAHSAGAQITSSGNSCNVGDNKQEAENPGGTIGDKLSNDSAEGSVQISNSYSDLQRCYDTSAASRTMLEDYDCQRNGKFSDLHMQHTLNSSEGNVGPFEMFNASVKKIGRDMTQAKSESSLDDHIQISPTTSYSELESEPSEDGDVHDSGSTEKSWRRTLSNSLTEQNLVSEADYSLPRCLEGDRIKMEAVSCKHSPRVRSPVGDGRKHSYQRVYQVSDLKSCDDVAAHPIPNAEHFYDRGCSRTLHKRRKEKQLDSASADDLSFHRETKSSIGNRDRKSDDNCAQATDRRHCHRKGYRKSRDLVDAYLRRELDERESSSKGRLCTTTGKMILREWYRHERDTSPLTYYESHHSTSNYSSFMESERGSQWRREYDDFQHRKTVKNDPLLQSRFTDGLPLDRFGKLVPWDDRGKNHSKFRQERSSLDSAGVRTSGRGEQHCGGSSLELDYLQSLGDNDEYWDQQILSSRPFREFYPAHNEKRHDSMLWADDMYDSESVERYERHARRRFVKGATGGRYIYRHGNAYGTEAALRYLSPEISVERRYNFHSEAWDLSEDEWSCGNPDRIFYDDNILHSFEGVSGHQRDDAKHKFVDPRVSMGVRQIVNHHRIMRGVSGRSGHTSLKMSNKAVHEQTRQRLRSSVELDYVVREGKSAGGHSEVGNIACNDNSEGRDMCMSIGRKRFKDVNEHSQRSMNAEVPKYEASQHAKFPIPVRDDNSDLEEGQIATEELKSKNVFQRKHASGYAEPIGRLKRIMLQPQSEDTKNEVDHDRILQTLAKMEKRRERFKEPISLKKDSDVTNIKPQVPSVEAAAPQQQRPARKRRWGGS